MNGSEDCNKFAGDLKATSGFTAKINDWVFQGMAGDNAALVCNRALPPATECVVQNTPVDCTTQGKPTSLTFLFNGNTCANPDNTNPQSGKYVCTGAIDPADSISVGNSQGYTFDKTGVAPGETFTVLASTATSRRR
jgi:hypothetical protein